VVRITECESPFSSGSSLKSSLNLCMRSISEIIPCVMRRSHHTNMPASGVVHSASPVRWVRIARSKMSRFSR
jgi:hypothetical protein